MAALAPLLAGGAGISYATAGGDRDAPLAGSARDQAVAAALEATGGGTVSETKVGDDGASYSVEVRLDDSFKVIGQEADDDGPADQDGPTDD